VRLPTVVSLAESIMPVCAVYTNAIISIFINTAVHFIYGIHFVTTFTIEIIVIERVSVIHTDYLVVVADNPYPLCTSVPSVKFYLFVII
jgi:hypothetical protein